LKGLKEEMIRRISCQRRSRPLTLKDNTRREKEEESVTPLGTDNCHLEKQELNVKLSSHSLRIAERRLKSKRERTALALANNSLRLHRLLEEIQEKKGIENGDNDIS
jgi:hypothetical protein